MIGNKCKQIEELKKEWRKLQNEHLEIEMVSGDFSIYNTFYNFVNNYDKRSRKYRVDVVSLPFFTLLIAELIKNYPKATICRQCRIKYLLKIDSEEREIYKKYDICVYANSVPKVYVDVKGNIDNVQSDLFMALLRKNIDLKNKNECKIIEIVYERKNMSKYKRKYGSYKQGEDKKQKTFLEYLKNNKYKYLDDYYYFYGHKEEDENDKREAKKHFDIEIKRLKELLNKVLYKNKGVK
jgi:hypothetical protein